MTRASKWAALVLTLSLALPVWAAPDPVKDCPPGLVCLTETEASIIETNRALLRERVRELNARVPKPLGGFWSAGVTASPVGMGGYGEVGLYAGPVSVGVELYDYSKPGVGLNVAWTRRW